MNDLISRQAAIDFVDDIPYIKDHPNIGLLWKAWVEQLPPAKTEPQSRMVFGYPLEYLAAFAEACRRAGVDESDLKTFANNCEFAYATMEEEYRRQINQAIDAFMGNAGGTNESD